MNDFEKIEHLLLSKKFEELSPTEVKEVNDYFENANDYNDMRDTLMQVKSTLAADKLLIKPNVDLKEKLLQQFEQTYSNQNSTAGKTRPFYKKVGFQWSAAASVVIIISLSIFGYINNLGGNKSDEMAVNYKSKQTVPAEETSISSGETEHGTGNTTTDGKEKVIVVNPDVISDESNIDESDRKRVYGNYFVQEKEVTEGESNEMNNAPVTTNTEDNILKNGFGDNTVGGMNTNTNEEKKDADKVLTNAYRDENVYKKEDTKTMEINTTIPTNSQSQNLGNTQMVNKDQLVDKKDYWGKKKNSNKNKTKTDSNKGKLGTENADLTNGKDSVLTRADSLRLDSNQKIMNYNGNIQMDDNKKKDE
jgi:hypothetical protein